MKKKPFFKTILALILICFSSCVSKKTILPQENEPPVAFKSDRYAICMLTKTMPPSLLAQAFLRDKNLAWMIEDANKKVLYNE